MEFLYALIIVVCIGAVAFLIYFLINKQNKKKNPPEVKKDEKEIIQEELDRVLEKVEDKDLADKISNYKEKDE